MISKKLVLAFGAFLAYFFTDKTGLTRLGMGAIDSPPWLRFIAPKQENVIWGMLIGAQNNGRPLLLVKHPIRRYVLFCLAMLAGSFVLFSLRSDAIVLLAVVILISTAYGYLMWPLTNFNQQIAYCGVVAELRLAPVENRTYIEAFVRYFLLVNLLNIPPVLFFWMGNYLGRSEQWFFGYGFISLFPVLIVIGLATGWFLCWGSIYREWEANTLLAIGVILALSAVYPSVIASVEKPWLIGALLLAAAGYAALAGSYLFWRASRDYEKRILPKLHLAKPMKDGEAAKL